MSKPRNQYAERAERKLGRGTLVEVDGTFYWEQPLNAKLTGAPGESEATE